MVKKCFKKQFSKIFLSKTTRARAFIFGIKHHLEIFYQICSKFAPGAKIDPAPGAQFYIELLKEKFKLLLLNH